MEVGQPVEYKVLVLPDVVEEKTSGGIILAQSVQERERMRAVKGTIIALGGNCFEDWNAPIPVVGDRIIFAVNAGTVHKANGKEYRIIHDKEIVMILPQEEKVSINIPTKQCDVCGKDINNDLGAMIDRTGRRYCSACWEIK